MTRLPFEAFIVRLADVYSYLFRVFCCGKEQQLCYNAHRFDGVTFLHLLVYFFFYNSILDEKNLLFLARRTEELESGLTSATSHRWIKSRSLGDMQFNHLLRTGGVDTNCTDQLTITDCTSESHKRIQHFTHFF